MANPEDKNTTEFKDTDKQVFDQETNNENLANSNAFNEDLGNISSEKMEEIFGKATFDDFDVTISSAIENKEQAESLADKIEYTEKQLEILKENEQKSLATLETMQESAKEKAQLLSQEEQKVTSLYSQLDNINSALETITNKKTDLEEVIKIKEQTFIAAQNDLHSSKDLLEKIECDLKQVRNYLSETEVELQIQSNRLTEVCANWQQTYAELQQQKEKHQEDMYNVQKTQKQIEMLAEEKRQFEDYSSTLMADMAIAKHEDNLNAKDFDSLEQSISQNKTINWDEKPKKGKKTFLIVFICLLLAFLIAFGVRTFVGEVTSIVGPSMEPTLESGDKVITSHLNYTPERNDIVIFKAPDTYNETYYIKRVIAIGGDHIVIKDGKVSVNNNTLNENYLDNGTITGGDIDLVVPQGEVFVLGDNRDVSHDSRNPNVSTIKNSSIIGKALYRVYPFSSFGNIYE